MENAKLDTPTAITYSSSDVIAVAVVGVGALSVLAYVVQSVAGLPGVVIPLGVLWIVAGIIYIRGADGRAVVVQLSMVPKEYKKWLMSAVIFGLLMPAVFPNGAYETSPWLMWFNATVLVCGCLGVWATRFFGACVQRLVQSRTKLNRRD